MICYCVFRRRPELDDSNDYVGLQGPDGQRVRGDAVQVTPHPTIEGLWRLGPFYIPDQTSLELPGALV